MSHKLSQADFVILRLLVMLLRDCPYPSGNMQWELIELWAKDSLKEAEHE